MKERRVIEYSEDIYTPGEGRGVRGRRLMRCEVELTIPVENMAQAMGARACRSKSGKCQDGFVVVKRIGEPLELSRKMLPKPPLEDR